MIRLSSRKEFEKLWKKCLEFVRGREENQKL